MSVKISEFLPRLEELSFFDESGASTMLNVVVKAKYPQLWGYFVSQIIISLSLFCYSF